MVCPKCGSENVTIQAVNVVKEKKKKGVVYWLLIGWWWELISWVAFLIPKLIFAIFGKHTKVVSKTETYAVCQNCGNKWRVKK